MDNGLPANQRTSRKTTFHTGPLTEGEIKTILAIPALTRNTSSGKWIIPYNLIKPLGKSCWKSHYTTLLRQIIGYTKVWDQACDGLDLDSDESMHKINSIYAKIAGDLKDLGFDATWERVKAKCLALNIVMGEDRAYVAPKNFKQACYALTSTKHQLEVFRTNPNQYFDENWSVVRELFSTEIDWIPAFLAKYLDKHNIDPTNVLDQDGRKSKRHFLVRGMLNASSKMKKILVDCEENAVGCSCRDKRPAVSEMNTYSEMTLQSKVGKNKTVFIVMSKTNANPMKKNIDLKIRSIASIVMTSTNPDTGECYDLDEFQEMCKESWKCKHEFTYCYKV